MVSVRGCGGARVCPALCFVIVECEAYGGQSCGKVLSCSGDVFGRGDDIDVVHVCGDGGLGVVLFNVVMGVEECCVEGEGEGGGC